MKLAEDKWQWYTTAMVSTPRGATAVSALLSGYNDEEGLEAHAPKQEAWEILKTWAGKAFNDKDYKIIEHRKLLQGYSDVVVFSHGNEHIVAVWPID